MYAPSWLRLDDLSQDDAYEVDPPVDGATVICLHPRDLPEGGQGECGWRGTLAELRLCALLAAAPAADTKGDDDPDADDETDA